jgi:antitoxin component YwqK of YwqJK toxin-antitoxin module
METKIKRTYWSNGQLQSERAHVDKVPHGVSKWWDTSGHLRSEHPYVGGKLHGMEKQWSQSGGIVWFRLYNQSEQVAKFNPRNQTQRWKLK